VTDNPAASRKPQLRKDFRRTIAGIRGVSAERCAKERVKPMTDDACGELEILVPQLPAAGRQKILRRTGLWMAVGMLWVALACNLPEAVRTAWETENPSATGKATPSATRPLPTGTPTPFPSYENSLCGGKPTTVAVLADPALAFAVRSGLDQFEFDLCAAGYGVVERTLDFAAPPDVRSYLADLHRRMDRKLEGAIFIGRVPLAYQYVAFNSGNPGVKTEPEEAISFQYYSDLDGEFSQSAEHRSPGGHEYSYDQHTGEVDWEIWTAILPVYRDDEEQTIGDLKRYFEKNHRYRSGGYSLPQGFLMVTEHYTAETAAEQTNFLNALRTGDYAWTPLSTAANAQFYFDGPTVSVSDGYAALSAGAADITVVEAHGDYEMSGRIHIPWVETNPVRTVLFWTGGCSVGNLDHPENFLTAIVYSPTSEVLAASGSTNDSGGLGTNREGFYGHNIAARLAAGQNLGQAVLGHMNVPLVSPWDKSFEYHHALLILIGDPTLRLRE
jgi:hypothetical protein